MVGVVFHTIFFGCVFGTLVILILLLYQKPGIAEVIKYVFDLDRSLSSTIEGTWELSTTFPLAIIVAGIAFYYISIASILVLHALRIYMIRDNGFIKKSHYFIVKLISTILFLTILLMIGIISIPYNFPIWFLLFYSVSCIPIFIFLAFLCYISGITNENEKDKLFCVYGKSKREKDDLKDIIESYRRQRVHGDLFFVLLLEIILGGALFAAKSILEAEIIVFI